MNPSLELLQRHRSIRRFRDEPVPDEDIRAAVQAGQAASTSSAVQAYALLRIRDRATRERLVALTGGQEKVSACGVFFAVCGDTRRHRLACERDGLPYRARLEAFLLAVIDATLFAQNLVVAFESMGYGICYIGGLRNDLPAVDRLLELPEGVYPLYGLCVGVPDEAPAARPRLPLESVLLDERYPDDATMRVWLDQYDEVYRKYQRERGLPPERVGGWSRIMSEKFSRIRREELGSYYHEKGARLD